MANPGVSISWTDEKTGELKVIRFDVVTNDTYEAIMAITSHPVEKGDGVTDNVREDKVTLTIEAFMSGKPLFSNPNVEKIAAYENVELDIPESRGGPSLLTPGGLTQALTSFVSDLFGASKPGNKAFVLKSAGPSTAAERVAEVFTTLEAARRSATRVRVIAGGGLHDLEDMVIEKVSTPRTAETSGGLPLNIDLSQISVVSGETVEAPEAAEKRGQPAENKGSKAAQAADAKKAEQLQSILDMGVEKGESFIGSFKKPF